MTCARCKGAGQIETRFPVSQRFMAQFSTPDGTQPRFGQRVEISPCPDCNMALVIARLEDAHGPGSFNPARAVYALRDGDE